MVIDRKLVVGDLRQQIDTFWALSGQKIESIGKSELKGTPVYTVNGKYVAKGWTEWTQGFQFGSALLQYDATREERFVVSGKKQTLEKMAVHLTHNGVHDHGFNNVSTYGNLLRMMQEGVIPESTWERNFYELALKVSGAVQAMRWMPAKEGGYIYSFNGPQSLFVDTIRSCRILMLSHALGHTLQTENDERVSLFHRAVQHLISTARYSVYYGEGRDQYDVWGRTAHESLFNVNDGRYRCPNSQQGFSGFTTWTRGLAWAMCGFAEQLEFLDRAPSEWLPVEQTAESLTTILLKAARATCDFYIANTATDGIPYWDTGAPGLSRLGDYLNKPSDPYNLFEPVDSSAAAVAAQGLLRLGKYLNDRKIADGATYIQAGLTVAKTLLSDTYLSSEEQHEGLILHSVYHRPNGWDNIPDGKSIPCDESSMWGDYHARELMLYLQKQIQNEAYYTFFNIGLKTINNQSVPIHAESTFKK